MMTQRIIIGATSLLAFGCLWLGLALYLNDPQILPRPDELFGPWQREWQSGQLQIHLVHTLVRVCWAFCLAMGLGCLIGFAMGRYEAINQWLDPWLVVFLNLPALVLIVLCYLWIGLTEAAAIAAVTLNKIPNVVVMIREGARALAHEYDELAKVYRITGWRYLRHVLLPQLAPYLAAAARSGIAVIWKIVLVVELLGRSNGVGFQIHLYFQLFDVAMVLVYAFSFIAIMLVIEWGILQPIERSARSWRQVC